MKIASWNVNGIRPRKEQILALLQSHNIDVLCLQETKIADEIFPHQEFIDAGYSHLHIIGQKAHHGVAIISRMPFVAKDRCVFAGIDDKRHAQVLLESGLAVHCFYVPSGGDVPDKAANPKFAHKIRFLNEMKLMAEKQSGAALWMGDLNVAYQENDTWDHKKNRRLVGHSDEERAALAAVVSQGRFHDLPRLEVGDDARLFTWWGYRYKLSVEKDYGWRLDHMLATPDLAKSITKCMVLKETRLFERPSDHVPILTELY